MDIFRSTKTAKYLNALLAVMMIAFAVRAVIPAGFMPEVHEGVTRLVICTSSGEKTISLPSGDQEQPDHKSAAGEHCPYQTLTTAKLLPAPSVLFLYQPIVLPGVQKPADDPFLTALNATTIAARGPPSA